MGGAKNTARWLEESKARRGHKTWIKIGNNKVQRSKAFEDVPPEFQEELRDSQKSCRKSRNKRKYEELKGSLERLQRKGTRMAQIRSWLFDDQPIDDDDGRVVARLRSKFRRFRNQDDDKLKRRMMRLRLPEFHARQIEVDDQYDPFRTGPRRRKRKRDNREAHQVAEPATKLKPLEVKSSKWKGTTEKWLAIPELQLAKRILGRPS
jgi:hypothetical protein